MRSLQWYKRGAAYSNDFSAADKGKSEVLEIGIRLK